jgi:hypothetical protein
MPTTTTTASAMSPTTAGSSRTRRTSAATATASGLRATPTRILQLSNPRDVAFEVSREFFENAATLEFALRAVRPATVRLAAADDRHRMRERLPARIVDRDGNVLGEAQGGVEHRLALPVGSIDG